MRKINTEDIAKTMVRALQKTMNEDFGEQKAPNFITTSIVDKETGEKFEFTVKRHGGMTPEEKLKELQKELDRCKGGNRMKSFEINVGIADEMLFLRVPNAIDEDDAIRQVYDSDQVNEHDAEDVDQLEIIEIIEGVGE